MGHCTIFLKKNGEAKARMFSSSLDDEWEACVAVAESIGIPESDVKWDEDNTGKIAGYEVTVCWHCEIAEEIFND